MRDPGLIEVLGKKYNKDILLAADEPKSAQELSEELDVPIATCYRRISELEQAGLLELHGRPLSEERRRVKVYRRSVESIQIGFDDELTVETEDRPEKTNNLDDIWRDVSSR